MLPPEGDRELATSTPLGEPEISDSDNGSHRNPLECGSDSVLPLPDADDPLASPANLSGESSTAAAFSVRKDEHSASAWKSGSSSVKQPEAATLYRKVGKWFGVTVLFAVFPVSCDTLILFLKEAPISMDSLFSAPASFLIGFAICASGFGDVLYEYRPRGQPGGFFIVMMTISFMTLTFGVLFYALYQDYPRRGWEIPFVYLLAASFVSLASTVVAARSA